MWWPFKHKKKPLMVQPQDWVVYTEDGSLHNGVAVTVATDGTLVSVARHEDYHAYQQKLKTDEHALVNIRWVRIKQIEAIVGSSRPEPSKDAIPSEVADEVRKLLAVCEPVEAVELLRSLHEGLAPVAGIGAS